MTAGYYRVDVSETISVLTFNNEYFDNDSDESTVANEGTLVLDWLLAVNAWSTVFA